MKMRSVAPMKIAKIGYIVVSVLFCIAGILFIALPEISTKIVGIEIGIAAIVFGIVKLIGYFSKDLYRLAFQFDLEFGILMVILGTIVLFNPENLMAFIAAAFGIAILFDGLFKIRIALDSKRFGIKDWWLIFSFANCKYKLDTRMNKNSSAQAGLDCHTASTAGAVKDAAGKAQPVP